MEVITNISAITTNTSLQLQIKLVTDGKGLSMLMSICLHYFSPFSFYFPVTQKQQTQKSAKTFNGQIMGSLSSILNIYIRNSHRNAVTALLLICVNHPTLYKPPASGQYLLELSNKGKNERKGGKVYKEKCAGNVRTEKNDTLS